MPQSWEQYVQGQEAAELGKFLGQIVKAVREQNQGRNLNCWPVLSFGWKDADLDAGGCTGIKQITWKDEDTLLVTVGGHKTFCYDEEDNDELREADWEYLCDSCAGLSCDGDNEEFTAGFHEDVEVPLVFKDVEFDMEATVNAVIEKAEAACDVFEHRMAEIEKGREQEAQQ